MVAFHCVAQIDLQLSILHLNPRVLGFQVCFHAYPARAGHDNGTLSLPITMQLIPHYLCFLCEPVLLLEGFSVT